MAIFVIEIGSDASVIVHDKVRYENKRKIDKSFKSRPNEDGFSQILYQMKLWNVYFL